MDVNATEATLDSLAVDREAISEVCGRYGITELAVFGSVARGAAREDSDVDLLYVLVPGRHLGFSINRLEDELSDLFGRPVDLLSRSALHRMMRDVVLAEVRTLDAA